MIRTLTATEIESWLVEHDALATVPTFREIRVDREHSTVNFENDTPGRMLVHARSSIAWLLAGEARPALLVVHEQGIWDSAELRSLFGLLRADSCSITDLADRPGHAFEPDQSDRLTEALWLSMCFGWGVRVHVARNDRMIQTDHDGHLWRRDPHPTSRPE